MFRSRISPHTRLYLSFYGFQPNTPVTITINTGNGPVLVHVMSDAGGNVVVPVLWNGKDLVIQGHSYPVVSSGALNVVARGLDPSGKLTAHDFAAKLLTKTVNNCGNDNDDNDDETIDILIGLATGLAFAGGNAYFMYRTWWRRGENESYVL